MFRLLSISILLILPLQSIASVSYAVHIAVYKNVDSLHRQLNKLSPKLRKTIEIQKREKLHIATSLHTKDKKTLQKLLPSYKKVFPDAFISTYQKPKRNATKVKKELPQIAQERDKVAYSRKIIDPTIEDVSFYDRIQQKTLYLCAYGKDTWSPNVLIHVTFRKKEVTYTPIMGEVSPRKVAYKIKNNKLYLSQKGLFNPEIYSTLESVTSHYYLISSWIGKRKINTIRYYFDLDAAKAYVASLT